MWDEQYLPELRHYRTLAQKPHRLVLKPKFQTMPVLLSSEVESLGRRQLTILES